MLNKVRNFLADRVNVFPESYFEHQSEADKQRFRKFNADSEKLIDFLRP